jgi:hypothetical protein
MTTQNHGPAGGGKKRPAWAGEELVACVDGPMAGQWHTAADWTHRLEAALYMADRQQPPAAALAYAPTGRSVAHPHVADVTGAAWSSHPADVDAPAEEPAAGGTEGRDHVEDGWAW